MTTKEAFDEILRGFHYIDNELLGERVEKKHGDARRKICDACELKKGGILPRCGVCSCLLNVMPYYKTHILKGKGTKKTVTCEHPKGSKWVGVDKEFGLQ